MSDGCYHERAQLVAFIASRFHSYLAPPQDREPGFAYAVYIESDVGQLSWHIADPDLIFFDFLERREMPGLWDGHTTAEKYHRLRRLTVETVEP